MVGHGFRQTALSVRKTHCLALQKFCHCLSCSFSDIFILPLAQALLPIKNSKVTSFAMLCFRIYVICNYSTMRGNKPCEIQTTSSVLYYTTLGPPKAPRLRVVRVDLYQVSCCCWLLLSY